jgi:hypothetical protein
VIRYIVAAILGVIYVACSIWIVRSQGEAYRHDLRLRRHELTEIAASKSHSMPPSGTGMASALGAVEIAKPNPVPDFDVDALRTTRERPKRPSSAAKNATPARDETSTGSPVPNLARPDRPQPGKLAGEFVPNKLLPLEHDAFWDQAALTKPWDLDGLTAEHEKTLGAALHQLVVRFNGQLEDDSGIGRLEALVKNLRKISRRRDIEYAVTILNSDAVNVFSHPGGYIYVSRKLMEMVGEDEDYVLEFALAHEIAHVEMLHAFLCLKAPDVQKYQDGTLTKLYLLMIPMAYPDEMEYAADKWALQAMKQLGRSDHDCLAFLRKLDAYAKRGGFAAARARPKDEPLPSPVENHLRSHPTPRKRLDELKALRTELAKPAK